MSRKIVITSGKGGVGKTTLSANLGIALALDGASVALVDADIGLNNLDVVMGIEHKVVYDIGDVVSSRCRLKQALIQDRFLSNLMVLPASQDRDIEKITTHAFRSIVDELANSFDYVLIDCPAGIDKGFHRAVSSASEAIVVTTPHISAVRDADKVLGLLTTYDVDRVGLVVNRIRNDLVNRGDMMSANDVAKLVRTELIGAVPDDDKITIFAQIGRLTADNSSSYSAYRLLARTIASGTTELLVEKSGIFSKLKSMMRGNKN